MQYALLHWAVWQLLICFALAHSPEFEYLEELKNKSKKLIEKRTQKCKAYAATQNGEITADSLILMLPPARIMFFSAIYRAYEKFLYKEIENFNQLVAKYQQNQHWSKLAELMKRYPSPSFKLFRKALESAQAFTCYENKPLSALVDLIKTNCEMEHDFGVMRVLADSKISLEISLIDIPKYQEIIRSYVAAYKDYERSIAETRQHLTAVFDPSLNSNFKKVFPPAHMSMFKQLEKAVILHEKQRHIGNMVAKLLRSYPPKVVRSVLPSYLFFSSPTLPTVDLEFNYKKFMKHPEHLSPLMSLLHNFYGIYDSVIPPSSQAGLSQLHLMEVFSIDKMKKLLETYRDIRKGLVDPTESTAVWQLIQLTILQDMLSNSCIQDIFTFIGTVSVDPNAYI